MALKEKNRQKQDKKTWALAYVNTYKKYWISAPCCVASNDPVTHDVGLITRGRLTVNICRVFKFGLWKRVETRTHSQININGGSDIDKDRTALRLHLTRIDSHEEVVRANNNINKTKVRFAVFKI